MTHTVIEAVRWVIFKDCPPPTTRHLFQKRSIRQLTSTNAFGRLSRVNPRSISLFLRRDRSSALRSCHLPLTTTSPRTSLLSWSVRWLPMKKTSSSTDVIWTLQLTIRSIVTAWNRKLMPIITTSERVTSIHSTDVISMFPRTAWIDDWVAASRMRSTLLVHSITRRQYDLSLVSGRFHRDFHDWKIAGIQKYASYIGNLVFRLRWRCILHMHFVFIYLA